MRKTAYIPPALAVQSYDELVAMAADHMDAEMVEAGLPYSAKIPRTFHWVLARVLGLLAGLVIRWHVFLLESIFASTARKLDQLKLIGGEVGIDYEDGDLASGHATIWASAPTVGGTLPAFKKIRDKLTGLEYYTTMPITVAPGSFADVAIVADGIGTEYLCAVDPAIILGPPAGISADALIKVDETARDAEDIEEYRTRIIDCKSNPPEGGADADWKGWARKLRTCSVDGVWIFDPESAYGADLWIPDEVAGVCFTKAALGVLQIPAAGDVTDMQTHLDNLEDIPTCAKGFAFAPTGQPVAIAIRAKAAVGYEDRTAELAGYMATSLQDMVRDRTQLASRPGITIENSYVQKAIGKVRGLDSYAITAIAGGSGADDVVSTNVWSYVYFVPTITWVV